MTEVDPERLADASPRPWMCGSEAEIDADVDAIVEFLTTADPDPAADARAVTTFLTQHDGRPITPALVFTLATFVRSVNSKNGGRNTRLDALEQRIKAQDARILELEASAAARSKVGV
jgi:hypothetical protein